MHVVDLNAGIEQVIGQILGHALGQRGHQHALLTGHALANLVLKIVNLASDRTNVDFGIEQAGRSNDLFNIVLTHTQLIVAWRGRDVNELRNPRLKLIETKRAVIERRRKTKTMLNKRNFARTVAFVHTANLRHRHMALVDDAKHILGEVVNQGKRRFTRLTSIQMARVVFDAVAKAHRLEHLEVIIGPLLQTLRLEQLVGRLELRHALLALFAD